MDLRDKLFPDSNITGKTDKFNQPILVGQTLRDGHGCEVKVFNVNGEYVVSDGLDIFPSSIHMPLNVFLTNSNGVEIVGNRDGCSH